MPNLLFCDAFGDIARGEIDLVNDPIYLALVASRYEPHPTKHRYWADVANYEISASGYFAGGQPLRNKSTTFESERGRTVWRAGNVRWEGTISATAGMLYKNTGDPTTSPLIGYLDFGRVTPSTHSYTTCFDRLNGIAFFGMRLERPASRQSTTVATVPKERLRRRRLVLG